MDSKARLIISITFPPTLIAYPAWRFVETMWESGDIRWLYLAIGLGLGSLFIIWFMPLVHLAHRGIQWFRRPIVVYYDPDQCERDRQDELDRQEELEYEINHGHPRPPDDD